MITARHTIWDSQSSEAAFSILARTFEITTTQAEQFKWTQVAYREVANVAEREFEKVLKTLRSSRMKTFKDVVDDYEAIQLFMNSNDIESSQALFKQLFPEAPNPESDGKEVEKTNSEADNKTPDFGTITIGELPATDNDAVKTTPYLLPEKVSEERKKLRVLLCDHLFALKQLRLLEQPAKEAKKSSPANAGKGIVNGVSSAISYIVGNSSSSSSTTNDAIEDMLAKMRKSSETLMVSTNMILEQLISMVPPSEYAKTDTRRALERGLANMQKMSFIISGVGFAAIMFASNYLINTHHDLTSRTFMIDNGVIGLLTLAWAGIYLFAHRTRSVTPFEPSTTIIKETTRQVNGENTSYAGDITETTKIAARITTTPHSQIPVYKGSEAGMKKTLTDHLVSFSDKTMIKKPIDTPPEIVAQSETTAAAKNPTLYVSFDKEEQKLWNAKKASV